MEDLVHSLTQRYAATMGAASDGHLAAIKQLWQLAYREASTMAYADAFQAVMVAFVVATLFVPMLRRVAMPKAPSSDAH